MQMITGPPIGYTRDFQSKRNPRNQQDPEVLTLPDAAPVE